MTLKEQNTIYAMQSTDNFLSLIIRLNIPRVTQIYNDQNQLIMYHNRNTMHTRVNPA